MMKNRIPYSIPDSEPHKMVEEAEAFRRSMQSRRSVRDFSRKAIPKEVLEEAIMTAGSAPNGANLQPWHFSVIQDSAIKSKIRTAAEEEERAFYNGRAGDEWLNALAPIGTDALKPFLEEAPALIAIFQKSKVLKESGEEQRTYYPKESVGIATGFLIAALHRAGLATLTHTPSPMRFLNEILQRPSEEKPFLLLIVGHPHEDCTVPEIFRKPLEEISTWH